MSRIKETGNSPASYLKSKQERESKFIKTKGFFIHLFVLSIIGTLLFSCDNKKTDVHLRLTHTENKLIQKAYQNRLDSLRPLWDSLCELNHDKMLSHALDSIIKQRLAEEEILRNRPVK